MRGTAVAWICELISSLAKESATEITEGTEKEQRLFSVNSVISVANTFHRCGQWLSWRLPAVERFFDAILRRRDRECEDNRIGPLTPALSPD